MTDERKLGVTRPTEADILRGGALDEEEADAGGGIPQSAVPGARMLPAGERRPASYFNEWWREHKEAFRQNQVGAVENAVKQVEASAKETFI